MDALDYRIERALNYIIAKSFPGKGIPYLRVEFLKNERNSYHGKYVGKKRTAYITNLSRPPAHVLATLLHEGAHHCEYSMTGGTGHQKSFYVIYHKLMETAVECCLVDYGTAKTVSDSASIRQLERHCGPVTTTADPDKRYNKDKVLVYVFYGYGIREPLSGRGYRYNSKAKAWEKVIDRDMLEDEEEFLKTLSDDIIIHTTEDMMDLTAYATVMVTGKTYGKRKELSSLGFRYVKEYRGKKFSGWWKRVVSTDLKSLERELSPLTEIPGIKVRIDY